jgi:hypothetical protein
MPDNLSAFYLYIYIATIVTCWSLLLSLESNLNAMILRRIIYEPKL